jgi:hypothetical protein
MTKSKPSTISSIHVSGNDLGKHNQSVHDGEHKNQIQNSDTEEDDKDEKKDAK